MIDQIHLSVAGVNVWAVIVACLIFAAATLGYAIRPIVDDWFRGQASLRDVALHFAGFTMFFLACVAIVGLFYALIGL